jgi:hypothetical protein
MNKDIYHDDFADRFWSYYRSHPEEMKRLGDGLREVVGT